MENWFHLCERVYHPFSSLYIHTISDFILLILRFPPDWLTLFNHCPSLSLLFSVSLTILSVSLHLLLYSFLSPFHPLSLSISYSPILSFYRSSFFSLSFSASFSSFYPAFTHIHFIRITTATLSHLSTLYFFVLNLSYFFRISRHLLFSLFSRLIVQAHHLFFQISNSLSLALFLRLSLSLPLYLVSSLPFPLPLFCPSLPP